MRASKSAGSDSAANLNVKSGSFLLGLAVAGALAVMVHEWPYINWQQAADPVDSMPLVVRHDAKGDGHFGSRRSGNRRHRGIDLTAPLNSPVRALRSGKVVKVDAHRGLGNYIEVDHGDHLKTLYAHLSEVTVRQGMRVRQGQEIGLIGKTGNAKHPWITPHVHLETIKDNTPIDPVLAGLRVPEAAAIMAASSDAQDETLDAAGGE